MLSAKLRQLLIFSTRNADVGSQSSNLARTNAPPCRSRFVTPASAAAARSGSPTARRVNRVPTATGSTFRHRTTFTTAVSVSTHGTAATAAGSAGCSRRRLLTSAVVRHTRTLMAVTGLPASNVTSSDTGSGAASGLPLVLAVASTVVPAASALPVPAEVVALFESAAMASAVPPQVSAAVPPAATAPMVSAIAVSAAAASLMPAAAPPVSAAAPLGAATRPLPVVSVAAPLVSAAAVAGAMSAATALLAVAPLVSSIAVSAATMPVAASTGSLGPQLSLRGCNKLAGE